MDRVRSKDGTLIAYERSGTGPALVLVHGTTADHTRWTPVLPMLEQKFTVEQVVDEFLQARSGDGYRSYLDQKIPGAFEQAVADAATPFEMELPGLLDWSFDEVKALRITQPTLAVLGAGSNALWPRFGETHRMLLEWLPHVQGFILPDATHFLQIQNPGGMARALGDFFVQHPIPQV